MKFKITFKDLTQLVVEADDCKSSGGWLSFVNDVDTEVQEPVDRPNGQGVEMKTVVRKRPVLIHGVNLSEVRDYRLLFQEGE